MSTYYREQGYSSRRHIWQKLRFVFYLFLVVAIAVIGFFVFDIYRQSKASDTPSASTTPVTSTITADSQVMRSQYFQFRTSNKWRAITSETKEDHYVYRQFNGPLVEQELVVDVNRDINEVLALVQTTRVLPVRINPNGTMQPGQEVSDHCLKAVPKDSKQQQIVKYREVTFACSPDGRSYVVVVGEVGGTTALALQRPSGQKSTYRITYKNVTANPSSRDLINMIESFESR